VRSLCFGVSLPHGRPELAEGARAFAEALEERVAYPVKLAVVAGYEPLLAGTLSGAIDAAWLSPILLVAAMEDGATLAAVCERGGHVTYRSVLLVRADSAFSDARALAGARLAWTARDSAAGYLFPRRHLAALGAGPTAAETFHGSYLAACGAVADGDADACACHADEASAQSPHKLLADVARVFPAAPWRLRVLDVTGAIPPDGVAIAPRLEPGLAASLARAFPKLDATPAGREGMQKLMNAERLIPPDAEVLRMFADLAASRAD
jgi:ABC-type phosphate/phosphonate transport system substrate-binding protein